MGLYMAEDREVAEKYRKNGAANNDFVYTIGGKDPSRYGITPDAMGLTKDELEWVLGHIQAGSEEKAINHWKTFNYTHKIEAFEKIRRILKENGLTGGDINIDYKDGKLFNWFANLNEENTLDEQLPFSKQSKEIQEKYKKAYEEDILPLLKELYGFDEDELEAGKKYLSPSREVRKIVFSGGAYLGAERFRKIMLKHGIKGIKYDGRQDGRCYVSFEGGGAVKLQDPFTFDDNGELIPLSKRFDKGNADMRWSFAGELGISRLQDGLALNQLEKAIELEKNGANADEIWRQTGWERSPVDGLWRFEIPYGKLKADSRYKVGFGQTIYSPVETYSPKRKYVLSDIWDAPVLFEAYPEIANISVKISENTRSRYDGKFNPKERSITIITKEPSLFGAGKDNIPEREIEETVQHEIQHAIQQIEKFADGGSVGGMRSVLGEARNPEEWKRLDALADEADKAYYDFTNKYGWDGNGRMPKAFKEKIAKEGLSAEYTDLVKRANAAIDAQAKLKAPEGEAYDAYHRLGGEVEARNSEKRMRMGEKERAERRPSLTASVEPSSQILLARDGEKGFGLKDFKTGESYKTPDAKLTFANMRWSFSPAEIKRELLSQKKIEIKSDKTTEKLLGEFSAQEKGWVGRVVKILSGILPKSVMSRIGEVSISNGSIKSALNHSRGKLKVQVLPQLEEILSDSIPITKEPIARSDGQLSYPMSRVIEWNGVPYVMTSVILEDKNGKRFYNHELTEIKRLDDAVHSGKDLYPRASEANKHRRALNEILYNDIWNVKENAGENKSKKTDFSFADNPIHQKKRALAVKLAKDMYGRLGKDFDASAPEARREVVPTEAERERILMDDLSFLDSDVEDVCNRATAILWKLINGTPKKTLKGDFDRMAVEAEKSFEYSRIVEACVKDALKDFKKELNLSEKMKAQERKDAQKEMDSVKGFTVDELAANGIDLLSAITEYSQAENGDFVSDTDAINAQVDAIIEYCKNWASNEDVSYDLAFAKMRATLTEVFNDLTDRLVYGKHVKSACQAVLSVAEANAERQLSDRAKKIGAKFAKLKSRRADLRWRLLRSGA